MDTRSGTAAVCPFKSIGGDAVLLMGKAAGQPGGGALVAENEGDEGAGARGTAEGGAVMFIEEDAHEQEGSGGRRQPTDAEGG